MSSTILRSPESLTYALCVCVWCIRSTSRSAEAASGALAAIAEKSTDNTKAITQALVNALSNRSTGRTKAVCTHACMRACMRACGHACMHACVHVCMRVCSTGRKAARPLAALSLLCRCTMLQAHANIHTMHTCIPCMQTYIPCNRCACLRASAYSVPTAERLKTSWRRSSHLS